MPTFIAVHKWPPEAMIPIMKEMAPAFAAIEAGQLPGGVKLCATYSYPQGAFCVWQAPSKEALEKVFKQFAPTLLKYTEFVQVAQSYPPTMEYVIGLWQMMLQAAPK